MRWLGPLFLLVVAGGFTYLAVRVALHLHGRFDLASNGLDLLGLVLGAFAPLLALLARPGRVRQALRTAQRHLGSLRAALDMFHASPAVMAFYQHAPGAPGIHDVGLPTLREAATGHVNGAITEMAIAIDLYAPQRSRLAAASDDLDSSHHVLMIALTHAVSPGSFPAKRADVVSNATAGMLRATSGAMVAVRDSLGRHAA